MREKGMRAWGKMTREGRFVRCDRVSRVLVPLRESERAKRMRETKCVCVCGLVGERERLIAPSLLPSFPASFPPFFPPSLLPSLLFSLP